MPDLKDIPDASRWRYAAGCAATIPALYEIAFREEEGKKFAEIETDIWAELGRRVATIAHECSLPARDAPEIARAVQAALVVLFGPEYGGEVLEHPGDRAVIVVRRCPFLYHSHMLDADHDRMFSRCMAFVLTAVPHLNKQYSGRFVRTMCTGDRQCEIKIEKMPAPADKKR
ncbi:MAG: hypothetical protein LUQ31_02755 [Methanoregula sp.]|nr:hypothetical protein [Methanoregula sp.]